MPLLTPHKTSNIFFEENFQELQILPHNLEKVKKYYSNGLSKFIEKINIEVITDPKVCKKLWNDFSPESSIFDVWEFRDSFSSNYKFDPYFLTIKKDGEVMATLPLCYDKNVKGYRWYGTSWNEDNKFFAKDPAYIPLLIYFAPRPIALYSITQNALQNIPYFMKFEKDDSKYCLNINGLKTVEEYLSQFKKKKRYNLKRDKKHIERLSPKIVINKFDDYNDMVEIGKRRFTEKGEIADWEEDPKTIDIFRSILENKNKTYTSRMMSVYIEDKLVAADILAIYNGTYYTLKGGYNTQEHPGIGNYMNLIEIEDAIKLGCKSVDFLQEDYGWKNSWLFDEVGLFKFEDFSNK